MNRIALVTGAGSGVGRAAALALGCQVSQNALRIIDSNRIESWFQIIGGGLGAGVLRVCNRTAQRNREEP